MYKKIILKNRWFIRIEPARAEYLLWITLRYCLRRFRSDKGNQARPVDQRFLHFVARTYTDRLRASDEQDRESARKRAKRLQRYRESLDQPEPAPDFATRHFWDEARALLAQAIDSLDLVSKAYVKLRYIDRLTNAQIAKILGVSERTVIRKYNTIYTINNLGSMLKLSIRSSIMQTDKQKLYKAIYSLIYENDFSPAEVARLFCMSRDDVKRLHDEMLSHMVSGYVEDATRLAS